VIPFDDAGRRETSVPHFDADCRAGLDWLGKYPKVVAGSFSPATVKASFAEYLPFSGVLISHLKP
jgi:hypothetical protein